VCHRLNQLLYFQRRHLDDGGLFLGRKTLRLNPAVITTEAWDFEAALDAGDYETAVRIYVGPFLDGFFLSHAPAFERWAEDQRRRLEKRCAEAITALAKDEALRGRPSQARAWWRRAAELDPFNTQTVRHLVEASLAVGDRVAALRDAQHHADLLRTELQLAADPGLTRLLAHLRDGSDTG
jgi:DNA-binding SARP family transcriptional activator